MMNFNQQNLTRRDIEKMLDEALVLLPQETQDFLMGGDFLKALTQLQRRYKFNMDEATVIQLGTMLALHDLTPVDELRTEIILALRNRSDAEIERIMKEIDEKILSHAPKETFFEKMEKSSQEESLEEGDSQETNEKEKTTQE